MISSSSSSESTSIVAGIYDESNNDIGVVESPNSSLSLLSFFFLHFSPLECLGYQNSFGNFSLSSAFF